MPRLSLIRPIDQPPGTRRLLQDLKNALHDKRFSTFKLIVAYAKSGPLHRLREYLESWREVRKKAHAILGIDQQGTSKEALELALSLFDSVYVTHAYGITFHPKIYLFTGDQFARAFVGSNNLTVGGTEKNFEATIDVELELPADADDLEALESAWTELLPASCSATRLLTNALLQELLDDGIVVPERAMRPNAGEDAKLGRPLRASMARFDVLPESPLPKKLLSTKLTPAKLGSKYETVGAVANVRGFAIQIKPHHNGEIFLSRTAAAQNPSFFGWPFTGKTTPKRAGNPSYPQLDPDPIVNIAVFGHAPEPILTLNSYRLNTVYYEKKSEIRITASPLVKVVPEYSVMVIERSDTPGITYEITIYTPDSPEYSGWEEACNQTMPGGGKKPRKFGWF